MNRTIEYLITEKEDGLRIEQFLRRKGYSGQNLAEIKRMPKSILVNGVHYYMRQTLTAGDILKVIICETKCSEKIPPAEIPLDIIYEDEDIIVINKPSGMPVHPSMGNHTNTLANALMYYYKNQNKDFVFRCVNRLDKDTTGLTMIAKNSLSAAVLSNAVAKKQLQRQYTAICCGKIDSPLTIDCPIARLNGSTI